MCLWILKPQQWVYKRGIESNSWSKDINWMYVLLQWEFTLFQNHYEGWRVGGRQKSLAKRKTSFNQKKWRQGEWPKSLILLVSPTTMILFTSLTSLILSPTPHFIHCFNHTKDFFYPLSSHPLCLFSKVLSQHWDYTNYTI